jgi:AcrR family transcriptional regulator
MATSSNTGRPPRTRRSPEAARQQLLDAAEALIAERGPDGVTLRDVAQAVGVTAGLVTHYFGTHARLVRAVLQRRDAGTAERLRQELTAGGRAPDADALLGLLFTSLADPRRIRLFVWSAMQRRRRGASRHGLGDLVDLLEAAFQRSLPAAEVPPRARIEAVALLALSALHGWAIGKEAWLPSLGLGPATGERDQAFLGALTSVLRWYMAGGAGASR